MPLGPEFVSLKSSQVVPRPKPNEHTGADDFASVTFFVRLSTVLQHFASRQGGGQILIKIARKFEIFATLLPNPLRVAWCAMDSGRLACVFACAPSHTPALRRIL